MNKVAALSLLVAVGVVFVFSEECHRYSDCHLTTCPANATHVACMEHRCTCVTHVVCQDAADCSMQAMCHDRHAHYHCVDRRCLCLKDEHIDEGDKIPHGPGGHGPGP